MSTIVKLVVSFILLTVFSLTATGQDSAATIYSWKAESKKIAEGKYELTFKTPGSADWFLYAPNQVLLDVKTTELNFADSAIKQEGVFAIEVTKIKEQASSIFENTKVKIFDGEAVWNAIITIQGTVPAKLQGTLLYTFGRNDEF